MQSNKKSRVNADAVGNGTKHQTAPFLQNGVSPVDCCGYLRFLGRTSCRRNDPWHGCTIGVPACADTLRAPNDCSRTPVPFWEKNRTQMASANTQRMPLASSNPVPHTICVRRFPSVFSYFSHLPSGLSRSWATHRSVLWERVRTNTTAKTNTYSPQENRESSPHQELSHRSRLTVIARSRKNGSFDDGARSDSLYVLVQNGSTTERTFHRTVRK